MEVASAGAPGENSPIWKNPIVRPSITEATGVDKLMNFGGADAAMDGLEDDLSAKTGDCHAEDIGIWLRSFGVPSLMKHEASLLQQYDTVSQIRDLYKDTIEAFFEDCEITAPAHQSMFKAGIRAHVGAPSPA